MLNDKKSPERSIYNIRKSITEIKHTLEKQALQLEHHIKRTDLLEEYIKKHDIKYLELTDTIKREIPLLLGIIKDSNINQTRTLLKLLSVGGIALTTVMAIIDLILRFK